MFWLTRPPILRYAAAALLLATGFAVELWPEGVTLHPFTTRDLVAGEVIDASVVEMREVPRGLLVSVDIPATAVMDVSAGEPIVSSMLTEGATGTPEGWWSIEMPVPNRARAGSPVLIVTGAGERVEGVIEAVDPASDFSGTTGLVAVHPDGAQAVAIAVLSRDAAVLLGR